MFKGLQKLLQNEIKNIIIDKNQINNVYNKLVKSLLKKIIKIDYG